MEGEGKSLRRKNSEFGRISGGKLGKDQRTGKANRNQKRETNGSLKYITFTLIN